MVVLRAHLAIGLAALLFWGCKFDPAVTGLGYQDCESTDKCPGGLVCLKNLCVPDCDSIYTVAWLGPDYAGDPGEDLTKICPGGRCEATEKYLDVELPPWTFLEMGSKKSDEQLGTCDRVVIRLSIVAPEIAGQGRNLSVVIRGEKATGVVEEGGVIDLALFRQEDDLDRLFRLETRFYVVNREIFGWPVRLRLVPVATNTTAFFFIRDFEMSCCE